MNHKQLRNALREYGDIDVVIGEKLHVIYRGYAILFTHKAKAYSITNKDIEIMKNDMKNIDKLWTTLNVLCMIRHPIISYKRYKMSGTI